MTGSRKRGDKGQTSCPTSDLYHELQLLHSADVRGDLLFVRLHSKAAPKCRMKATNTCGKDTA